MGLHFSKISIVPILLETKTHTRRFWDAPRVKVGNRYKCRTNRFSKKFFAIIEVTELYREPLGLMNDHQARLEGYENVADFKQSWIKIHKGWQPSRMVYVVGFRVVAVPVSLRADFGYFMGLEPEDAEKFWNTWFWGDPHPILSDMGCKRL